MLLNILLIIVGVALVLWGADRMTDGASSVARRLNVPEIVIGLTIVAAGTSAPEFFVSMVSALKGTPDLAVGNVVGSNTFNTLLIVGCSAIVAPMTIARTTVTKDVPFAVGASVLLLVICADGWQSFDLRGNIISRLDGLWLLLGFAAFMFYTFREARKSSNSSETTTANAQEEAPVWKGLMWVMIGLTCLIVGSNVFVDAATDVATQLGVSQGVIGLTIVAGGTSLPELATSVVAARKGRSAMAIGNVIGSNVFNILFILGMTAVVCPMQIDGITTVDIAMMLVSVVLLWLFSFTKFTVARWEGVVLTLIFMGYMSWLLYNI